MAAAAYVVLADTQVTWGGETTFVRHGTVLSIDPASPLGAAYGGPSNLGTLPPYQAGEDADHTTLGN
jgi:hypothetical protein